METVEAIFKRKKNQPNQPMTKKQPPCSPREKKEQKNQTPKPTQEQHRAFDNGDPCLSDCSLLLRKTIPSQTNYFSANDVLIVMEVEVL